MVPGHVSNVVIRGSVLVDLLVNKLTLALEPVEKQNSRAGRGTHGCVDHLSQDQLINVMSVSKVQKIPNEYLPAQGERVSRSDFQYIARLRVEVHPLNPFLMFHPIFFPLSLSLVLRLFFLVNIAHSSNHSWRALPSKECSAYRVRCLAETESILMRSPIVVRPRDKPREKSRGFMFSRIRLLTAPAPT